MSFTQVKVAVEENITNFFYKTYMQTLEEFEQWLLEEQQKKFFEKITKDSGSKGKDSGRAWKMAFNKEKEKIKTTITRKQAKDKIVENV